jgi:hypothetical protein
MKFGRRIAFFRLLNDLIQTRSSLNRMKPSAASVCRRPRSGSSALLNHGALPPAQSINRRRLHDRCSSGAASVLSGCTCTKPFLLLNAMPRENGDTSAASFTPCTRIEPQHAVLCGINVPVHGDCGVVGCQRASASPDPGRVLGRPRILDASSAIGRARLSSGASIQSES